MQRIALIFFVVAVTLSTAFILVTGLQLPDPVASHFGWTRSADRYISRDRYLLLFTSLATLLPIALSGATAWSLRKACLGRVRHREFWDRPENRPTAIAYLTARSLVMGGVLALFLAAMHDLVLQANAMQPARLPYPAFPVLLGAFGVVFVVIALLFAVPMNRIARAGRRLDA